MMWDEMNWLMSGKADKEEKISTNVRKTNILLRKKKQTKKQEKEK